VAVAGLVLAPAGTARAASAEPFTEVSTFSDQFSGVLPCGNELYAVTANGTMVVHITYFPDTDTFHVLFHDHGIVVAVPIAGTGPTLTGNFWDLDSDNVRAVKNGGVLVEKDTDLMRAILHGSDGSRAFVLTHSQVTMNANGETSVQFEVDKLVCS
jgi:hypothetical protein